MNMRSYALALVVLAVAPVGCASSSGSSATQQSSRQRPSRDVITAEELATIDAQTALQAVQRLRPNFLQTRGGSSMSITQGPVSIVVYVDQTRMGGPSTLSQIPVTEVKEIRYLNATDATQRYGTGHGAGAIVVTRR
jgi:hypothetical protein